jgi:archaellum biogenesis protein FlaJ (TadC family)
MMLLVLILIAIEMVAALDPKGRYSFWPHLGAFAILSAIFFVIARVARVRRAKERLRPRTP